ncbi:phosphopantetheine-binding protein, partial [Streptomyces sp. NPDC001339]|uniref:acyl carrier protein n=1 Tax=Streptomyces sp. NPDC001339 TaxID=3364563 RepID=UPI0036908E9B
GAVEFLRRRGLGLLAPGVAVAALGRAVGCGDAVVTVADVDWGRFVPAFTSSRTSPLLTELPEARAALDALRPAPADGAPVTDALRDRLAGLSAPEAERAVLQLVRTEAATALGHRSVDALPTARTFTELGFDSLTAVEFRNRLNEATGLRLPATLVFDHPTPAALAARLREQLLPDAAAGGGADPQEARLREALASVPLAKFRDAGLMKALLELAGLDDPSTEPANGAADGAEEESLDEMDAEALVRMALDGLDDTES